jgi:hypothetical protein
MEENQIQTDQPAKPKDKKVLSRGVVLIFVAFLLVLIFGAYAFSIIIDGKSEAKDIKQDSVITMNSEGLAALKDSVAQNTQDINLLYGGYKQIVDSLKNHTAINKKQDKLISGAYGKINKLEKDNQVLLIQVQQLKDSVNAKPVNKPVVKKKTVNRTSLNQDDEEEEEEDEE